MGEYESPTIDPLASPGGGGEVEPAGAVAFAVMVVTYAAVVHAAAGAFTVWFLAAVYAP